MVDIGSILSNLWVVVFLILALMPRIQQSNLNNNRKRALIKLGKNRGTNVITLIHRQETISFLGIPISRHIDIDDSEEVVAPIDVELSDRPNDLPPSYLLSVDYSGPENRAYARLYEPESKKVFFWFDNTGHKPYCYTD